MRLKNPIYQILDRFNRESNSFEDILSHEWYEKTLPESWEDETKTLRLCKHFCQEK